MSEKEVFVVLWWVISIVTTIVFFLRSERIRLNNDLKRLEEDEIRNP